MEQESRLRKLIAYAEGMAGRIEQDAPALRLRMFRSPDRAQLDRRLLGPIQVGDGDLDMHLLGYVAPRPLESPMVGDPLHRDQYGRAAQRHEVVVLPDDLEPEELAPEN